MSKRGYFSRYLIIVKKIQSQPYCSFEEIRDYIEKLVGGDDIEHDKRFVYYLLAATGICVVPLTSFFTDLQGFRMTLLDKDEAEFERVIRTIAEKIVEYIESGK